MKVQLNLDRNTMFENSHVETALHFNARVGLFHFCVNKVCLDVNVLGRHSSRHHVPYNQINNFTLENV